jgi:hypothetical protein
MKPLDPLLYEHMARPGHSDGLTELGFGASEICTPVGNLTVVAQVDDSVWIMRLCVIRHFILLLVAMRRRCAPVGALRVNPAGPVRKR